MAESNSSEPVRVDSRKLTAWYDFQAPLYHFWRDDYNQPLVARTAELLDASGPIHVLDAGCGSGLFTIGLALKRPDWTFEGIDGSTGLLAIASREAEKRSLRNIQFHAGNVEALSFGNDVFTAVAAAGLFPNLNGSLPALREFFRVLKPGGQLVIVEFDRSTMTAVTRSFFRTMIFGYRLVSAVFSRFRFAEGWSIGTSTIDRDALLANVQEAGFRADAVLREYQHYLFVCRKP